MSEYSPNPDTAFISDVPIGPICLRSILAPNDVPLVDDIELHKEELDKAFITEQLTDDGRYSAILACRVEGCTALCSVDNTNGKAVIEPVKFSEYSVSLDSCRFDSRF